MKERHRNLAAYSVGWFSDIAWWIVTQVSPKEDVQNMLTWSHSCSGISLAAVTSTGLVQL